MPGAAALGLAADAPFLPPLAFNGVIGQRYKVHFKKGFNGEDLEGTNPNRYYFIGTYEGAEPDADLIMHVFTDINFASGIITYRFRIADHLFGVRYEAVPNREGGARKRRARTNCRRRGRRRTTRRRRA